MEQHPYRGLAVVLSFIFPGLGQIYNLEIGKGAGFMCAYVVSWALTCVFIGWLFLLGLASDGAGACAGTAPCVVSHGPG